MWNTTLNAQVTRIIISLAIGLVLVFFPSFFQNIVMYIVGGIIACMGLIELTTHIIDNNRGNKLPIPIGAILLTLLGTIILFKVEVFTSIIVFSLGFIILLIGISQILMYLNLRHTSIVPKQIYIFPVIITIAGILAIADPFGTINAMIIFFGATMLFYSISELFSLFIIKKR